MNNFAVPYKNLCDVFFSVNKSFEDYLRENYPVFEEDQINKIVGDINKTFFPQLNLRLRSVHRIRTKFNKKYCDWLQGVFVVNLISGDLEAVTMRLQGFSVTGADSIFASCNIRTNGSPS